MMRIGEGRNPYYSFSPADNNCIRFNVKSFHEIIYENGFVDEGKLQINITIKYTAC